MRIPKRLGFDVKYGVVAKGLIAFLFVVCGGFGIGLWLVGGVGFVVLVCYCERVGRCGGGGTPFPTFRRGITR